MLKRYRDIHHTANKNVPNAWSNTNMRGNTHLLGCSDPKQWSHPGVIPEIQVSGGTIILKKIT